jgi:ubiquinone/menaquinone biosynthesis C-methylase UbiE
MTAMAPVQGAFEELHRSQQEPWMFGARAAEILRHEWIVEAAQRLEPATTLDVGCTVGQLTERLARALPGVSAIDVSPTAVTSARHRIAAGVQFMSGSVTSLPIAPASFDLVIAADGIYSWNLVPSDREAALREIHRVLRPGGRAILTEHTRPARFGEFVGEVARSPLRVVNVDYLYDRPWYQFESWLRAVQRFGGARAIRRNVGIARVLRAVGRRIGPRASRHVCVLAERSS